jgi:hypothetical protein
MTMTAEPELSPKEWWSRQRAWYNLALILAGLGAFLAYAGVLAIRCAGDPEVEITIFTMAFQGVGYLIAMAFANLCYALGVWMEDLLRPSDVTTFRRWALGLGVAVSVALPFSIPVFLAIRGCSH